jgi:hypothetical protein
MGTDRGAFLNQLVASIGHEEECLRTIYLLRAELTSYDIPKLTSSLFCWICLRLCAA